MADEEEEGVRRRLLEHLEQGVGAGRFKLVDACRSRRPANRDSAGLRSKSSPSARTWSTLMLRAKPSPCSFGSARSSQRMSGWLPASTSLTIGWSSAFRCRAGRTPGPAASASTRRAAAWAKRRLAHAFRPGKQPGMMQLARCPGAGELLDGAILPDDHGSRSCDGVEQALGDFFRRYRTRRSAARVPALRRRSGGKPSPPCDDIRADGRRSGRCASLSRARARSLPFLEQEDERPVGEVFANAEGVDRAHSFDAEAARAALIGERTVDEAVGEHPCRPSQRGPDRLIDMVGAGRGEQQCLGFGSPAISSPLQKQLADGLGAAAPAGLTGDEARRCRDAASAAASALTCVDLPTPSPPSRLMKRPRVVTPSRTAA